MRLMTISLLLILISACGNDKMIINTKTAPTDAIQTQSGILSIPNQGVYGGGAMIHYQNQDLRMGTLSSEAESSLTAIEKGQVSFAPVSSNNITTSYRVNFIGTIGKGSCMMGPGVECTVVNLQKLTPY